MSVIRPRVRQDLLTTEVTNEIVLYDCQSHQAHSLSPVAATVWRLADGTRTVEEIARGAGMAADHNGEELVSKALAELDQKGLLVAGAAPRERQQSRRHVLRRAAGVAVAPLVLTLAAPTAADAASTTSRLDSGGGTGDFQPVQEPNPLQEPDIQDPPRFEDPKEPQGGSDQTVGDPPANNPQVQDPPVGDPPKPNPNNPPLNDQFGDPPGGNPSGGNPPGGNPPGSYQPPVPNGNFNPPTPKGRKVKRKRRRGRGLGGGATSPVATPGSVNARNGKAKGIER